MQTCKRSYECKRKNTMSIRGSFYNAIYHFVHFLCGAILPDKSTEFSKRLFHILTLTFQVFC